MIHLGKEENQKLNNDKLMNNKVKNERVADYLGSSGIKSTFNFKGNDGKNDKITNFNKEALLNTVNYKEPKKFKINSAHVFEGNKGYYL